MTIYNLGSINADHVYAVPHLPGPGETLAAESLTIGLGGKGTNQSVAAARAGSRVVHIGAVGADGAWARERIAGYGVNVDHVVRVDGPTGHAIINVDAGAENAIVLLKGANFAFDLSVVEAALADAGAGDVLLLQNETAFQVEAAQIAKSKGVRVVYSAAPFSVEAVKAVLPHVDLLAMNEIESQQLSEALGTTPEALDVPETLITKGAKGAVWRAARGEAFEVASFKVTPKDTTAAGDTFAGFFAAACEQGLSVPGAMRLAAGAAALKVTRAGAADAIPTRVEVEGFIADQE
ncbi:ribokinase [Pseudoruegeria sp. SHC-113]|uniref:ribokinase n=1 Tax=Pseudoruegeria sp. SHC-113 TaxID=2855439 RepID=UPI0021BB4062|nr:ribokinase [Pseudoruegeria sp. SHC-113]MCT8158564.1 ribokinase [Pseudoruegeria sp. SHC-113]